MRSARQLGALAVVSALLATPAQAQTTIGFDNVGAPCDLFHATPLTTQYAALGVTFSGGGFILNQCPPPYDTLDPYSGNGLWVISVPDNTLYETITFPAPQSLVSIFVSGEGNGGETIAMRAYDALHNEVGSSYVFSDLGWSQLSVAAPTISSVTFFTSAYAYRLDELSFTPTVVTTPEPGAVALLSTGLLALGGATAFRRRARVEAPELSTTAAKPTTTGEGWSRQSSPVAVAGGRGAVACGSEPLPGHPNDATTSTSRSTSASLLGMPNDARTAPTGSPPRHAEKRGSDQPSRRAPSRQRTVASAGKPNACAAAPGLQKQPPRTDTRASRARSST
jgi:hypothetical protein